MCYERCGVIRIRASAKALGARWSRGWCCGLGRRGMRLRLLKGALLRRGRSCGGCSRRAGGALFRADSCARKGRRRAETAMRTGPSRPPESCTRSGARCSGATRSTGAGWSSSRPCTTGGSSTTRSGTACRWCTATATRAASGDPVLGGRDPQVAHVRDFVAKRGDHGAVHVNSGIPNLAFFRFAQALGGHAWGAAGRVWYDALRSGLRSRCGFSTFAKATVAAARSHGARTVDAVQEAWESVGVSSGARRRRHHGMRAREVVEEVGVRGHVITAAVAVLADGLPRSSDEICREALARKLVPAGTSKRYVYTALIEYIARTKGHERKPLIVQDPDRRFRANHPADPWPAPVDAMSAGAPTAASLAVLERVRAAAVGDDPAAFESAVCALFGTLGFVAAHVGGNDAPDGYLDAPLGPLAYRVMLECKTGSANGFVTQPNVAEAAKYREKYGAAHCLLVGPAVGAQTTFASALRGLGGAAWPGDGVGAVVAAALYAGAG